MKTEHRRGPARRRVGLDRRRSPGRFEALESRDLPAALIWSPGISLPAPRAGAAAILDYQTVLAVGGGTTTVNSLDPGNTSWGTAQSIDLPRSYAGVGSTGSTLLVYGGSNGGAALDAALTYDPYNIDNIQDAAVMSVPRTRFAAATDGGTPYAIGGLDDSGNTLSSVERYDVNTNSWSHAAALPQGLYGASAVDDGAGHIYAFGGATANGSPSGSAYRYTVATNTWAAVASMPDPARDTAAALGSNGEMYVIGGVCAGGTLSAVQTYDPSQNTWTIDTSIPAPVSAAAAVTDASGRIEVIGGLDASGHAVATVTVSQALNQALAAPTFTSAAPPSVLVGQAYTYQATAAGNPAPTFSLSTAPAGMTINPTTGAISFKPTLGQGGDQAFTVVATNAAGQASQVDKVHVYTPPPTTPGRLREAAYTSRSVTLAWNPSNDKVGVTGYEVYQRVVVISRTGGHVYYIPTASVTTTSATITGLAPGKTYTYVVAALNASGSQSAYSTSLNVTTRSNPVLNWQAGNQVDATVQGTARHALTFQLTATGSPTAFTYALVSGPAGMTVDRTTGVVSWTPADSYVGADSFTFSVTSTAGTDRATIPFNISPNVPVLSTSYNGQANHVGSAFPTQPYSLQMTDTSGGGADTWSVVSGPAGMTIDPSTGVVSWTPGSSQVGYYPFTIQATNDAGSAQISLDVESIFADAPTNFAVQSVTSSTASLTWTAPAHVYGGSLTQYQVYEIFTYNNQTYITSVATGSTATDFVLSNLISKVTYTIYVVALDQDGNNGLSTQTITFTTA